MLSTDANITITSRSLLRLLTDALNQPGHRIEVIGMAEDVDGNYELVVRAAKASDDMVPWTPGGISPDSIVDVEFRNGDRIHGEPASAFRWDRRGAADDIVRYRIRG